ncbi:MULTISPECIES: pyridoxamine 5'-phosphate oxidase family protein [Chryseobacterium]|uniref:General stress protein 26 n=1 Tax=Chryseobacterium taihuense TaxID=1141221 RepID=A0A4V6IDC3_9FLAO|nr:MULTISPECIES: pyridoxamine 5'-phosphate oxidase family protein [Chryseobacterium]QQV04056.1 pyridoxamine 5'-phosphate oxidase family protein [Chryseobacterium sp. FDAARGOS 1104]VFB02584.1 General stress protein 26 [Chryseobacterium taihuense]
MSTENLSRTDAVKKIKELSEKAKFCMFCTELEKLPINTRPMSLQETDDEGNLWFISSDASNKNFQIKDDNRVQLIFMNNSDSEYLSVFGEANIYKDRATIEDKWSSMANAWFDGKDDPNVSIIRVTPKDTYYWDTKAGKLVSLITFAAAAITGNKTDNSDGIEGKAEI